MYFGSADKSITEIIGAISGKDAAVASKPVEVEEEQKQEEEVENEIFKDPTMSIGIPAEIFEAERRVAMTPSQVPKFRRMGFSVNVESGAGVNAGFRDLDYERYGAAIVSKPDAWSSDIVLKIRRVLPPEVHFLHKTKLLVSYVQAG
jgi:hypothetical protein